MMHRRPGGRSRRNIGGAPILSPGTIPGLVGWWRADKNVTLSTGVSSWGDILGISSPFTQATGANQPTLTASDANFNNLPSVTGNGTTQFLLSTNIALSNNTTTFVWMVQRLLSGAANNEWIEFNTATAIFELRGTGVGNAQPTVFASPDSGTPWGTSILGATKAMYGYASGTVIGVNVSNGIEVQTAHTSTSYPATNCALFGRNGSLLMNVSIAELIIGTQVPSSGTLAALQKYAVARYGIV